MPFNSNMNSLSNTDFEVNNLNHTREPDILPPERFTMLAYPELLERYRKANGYILPDLSGSQPRYNADELRRINGMDKEVLEGEGIGALFKKGSRSVKKAANDVKKEVVKEIKKRVSKKDIMKIAKDVVNELDDDHKFEQELVGEGIAKAFKKVGKALEKSANKTGDVVQKYGSKAGEALKKSATDKDGLIRDIISSTADVAIPEIATVLGAMASTAMTGDPTSGAYAGKQIGAIARKTLQKQTGYGSLKKYGDVGIYNGGSLKKSRNAIVKEIMNGKGLSLPQASKYVKDHGLYKK